MGARQRVRDLPLDQISRSEKVEHDVLSVRGFRYRDTGVGTGEAARDRTVLGVSASFFDFFDARPALGRFFVAAEDTTPAGANVAVLSFGLWQTAFAGRNVLGQPMSINDIKALLGSPPRDGADNDPQLRCWPLLGPHPDTRGVTTASSGSAHEWQLTAMAAPPEAIRIDFGRGARRARWRSGADGGRRVCVDRFAGRRRTIHRGDREGEGGQDLLDRSGLLNGGKQAHASTTSRAGEDVELEQALHELRPRPMADSTDGCFPQTAAASGAGVEP